MRRGRVVVEPVLLGGAALGPDEHERGRAENLAERGGARLIYIAASGEIVLGEDRAQMLSIDDLHLLGDEVADQGLDDLVGARAGSRAEGDLADLEAEARGMLQRDRCGRVGQLVEELGLCGGDGCRQDHSERGNPTHTGLLCRMG